jgi:DNA-binding MarR family transcriptional regulator
MEEGVKRPEDFAERKERMFMKTEKLNLLEAFLLSFVKSGLTAPYDLISQAGLSVGVTSPALKRLERSGYLNQTLGPRRRVDYSLTEKGEEELRASLESGRQDYWGLGRSSTYESALRAALLLWVHFGLEEANKCIEYAIKQLKVQAEVKEHEADGFNLTIEKRDLFDEQGDKGRLLATSFSWMKCSSDAELLKGQAESLSGLPGLLAKLPDTLRDRKRRTI